MICTMMMYGETTIESRPWNGSLKKKQTKREGFKLVDLKLALKIDAVLNCNYLLVSQRFTSVVFG